MAVPKLASIFVMSTNRLHLFNVRSQLEGGGSIDNAAGTAQLLDKGGVAISDPVALAPLGVGEYEAIFDVDPTIQKGQFVDVLIQLDGGPSLKYQGVIHAKAVENTPT